MKHVSIMPLYDATLTSIDSSHQLFSRVNDFMSYQGKPPFYDIEVVGLVKTTKLSNGLYTVNTDKTIKQIERTDVIVLPLLCGNFKKAIQENRKYTKWLTSQYHNGSEIICLCVGSFYLASTGLLDNKKCAVHWAAKNEFKEMFPNINIVDDSIITDEKGIYTCGGGYSYLNFECRFQKATSNTVIEYMQRVKMEVGKKGLETQRKTITDLMYDVGYSDIKAFRTTLKKIIGLSPTEYKKKFL